MASETVVLASGSAIRATLLRRAGVACEAHPPRVDEAALKHGLLAEQADGASVARHLAAAKAGYGSRNQPGRVVIGADQVLVCAGRIVDKPVDRADAEAQLRQLSGAVHEQIVGVCVMRDGRQLWHHLDRARLHMRPLSDAFIACYLDALGGDALLSPGAYQLEGLGAQLFTRVDGDFFTVLGLPLLPLLGYLRTLGVLTQ